MRREGRGRREQQRMIVVRADECRDRHDAVAAGAVLDHDGLAPARRQPIREQPRPDIGTAAGTERHDETHGALRPRLGGRLRRRDGREGQDDRKAGANGPQRGANSAHEHPRGPGRAAAPDQPRSYHRAGCGCTGPRVAPTVRWPARPRRLPQACLMNVPLLSSATARCSSAWVFITIGPYHATGSSSGLPDTSRNLMPPSPASTVTSSPLSNSTSERLPVRSRTSVSPLAVSFSVSTPNGSEAPENVPDPSNT